MRWTEEVAHGHFTGGFGSAGGELSEDPDLSGGETEGVMGLWNQFTSLIWAGFFLRLKKCLSD